MAATPIHNGKEMEGNNASARQRLRAKRTWLIAIPALLLAIGLMAMQIVRLNGPTL